MNKLKVMLIGVMVWNLILTFLIPGFQIVNHYKTKKMVERFEKKVDCLQRELVVNSQLQETIIESVITGKW